MPDLSQYFPITDPTLIFFVVLLIILFAPIVMGRLRIPHIIGMVLAGIAEEKPYPRSTLFTIWTLSS